MKYIPSPYPSPPKIVRGLFGSIVPIPTLPSSLIVIFTDALSSPEAVQKPKVAPLPVAVTALPTKLRVVAAVDKELPSS